MSARFSIRLVLPAKPHRLPYLQPHKTASELCTQKPGHIPQENSMPCSPVPSSPDIARPPKQTRSSVSKRRIAAMSGLSENPNSYRSFSGRGKQRGVASWQQQGAGLRAPDMASKKARLSCSPRKVKAALQALFSTASYTVGDYVQQPTLIALPIAG